MNDDVETQVKINSLMISKDAVKIIEYPYSEWDGEYINEFNTFL